LEGREIELVNQIVLERPPEKREIKKASDLIRLFNRCFKSSENTLLIGDASEPIYLPADEKSSFHRIFFTQDYFSSALHEVAHWCVAGSQRRKKVDYGYWYLPDGRSAQQQQAFEQVEVKPQALEAAFSMACNIQFRVSVDNLSGEETCSKPFELAVKKQLSTYIEHGFNPRTTQFLQALHRFYSSPPLI
jgi:elongation factor P hydroxylase